MQKIEGFQESRIQGKYSEKQEGLRNRRLRNQGFKGEENIQKRSGSEE